MKNLKKFAKNHKKSLIKWTIILVLIIIILVYVVKLLYPDAGTPVYGNRLDGMEQILISKERKDEVINKLQANEQVTSVEVHTSGKIVNITVEVIDDVDTNLGQQFGNQALESFVDAEKAYYDFQIFISKKTNSSPFPMVGYKNKKSSNISWGTNKQVAE